MTDSKKNDIAIVGMACWYPGANDLMEFWENILARRQQFRRMPDERLPQDSYFDKDPKTPDKTYGKEAAVIDGFDFDWRGHRIPKATYEGTDIVHWLALDVALKALRDAGYTADDVSKDKTGVLVGNLLTGEFTRSNSMRTRWPFVEKVFRNSSLAKNLSPESLDLYMKEMETQFKSVFPPVSEDTLAGGLSNTIAGRICNYLDLHGGGLTVDGACASSLLAVINGARGLVSGELDMAFAGGVDISLDTFELIGFAKTKALSADEMRVYDKKAKGFIPGEGCGFIVMKRLADAERDGDQIYSVIKGWGISSDGKGGLTAPSVPGQMMALDRAYEMAGYPISACDFIEGHGTGTAVGDQVEVAALMGQIARSPDLGPVGVTSLKSIIGHTKGAAGIGSVIKASLGLNRRIVPPTAGIDQPRDEFSKEGANLYPVMDGFVKDGDDPLRAGVSAMGFGGLNSHVTLEGFDDARYVEPDRDEEMLMASHESDEIIGVSAASLAALKRQIEDMKKEALKMSRSELLDFAAHQSRFIKHGDPVRAAIVATSPTDFLKQLEHLQLLIKEGLPVGALKVKGQAFISHDYRGKGIGFIFPGQGSQGGRMAEALKTKPLADIPSILGADQVLQADGHGKLWDLMAQADKSGNAASQLSQTQITQPAVCLASILWYKKLRAVGIVPKVLGGHSLGELTALYAAGAIQEDTLLELAAKRGKRMAESGQSGSMISIKAQKAEVETLLKEIKETVVIAGVNGPQQVVVSGDIKGIDALESLLKSRGMTARRLNVSAAFHSPLMEEGAKAFRHDLSSIGFKKTKIPMYSGIDGAKFGRDRDIDQYLVNQITAPMDFVQLVQSLSAECDFLVEAGPGHVLTQLVAQITQDEQRCMPVSGSRGRLSHFKNLVARAFCSGSRIVWDQLFRDRLTRPYTKVEDKLFITNPCERPLAEIPGVTPQAMPEQVWQPAPQVAPVAIQTPTPVLEHQPPVQAPAAPAVETLDPTAVLYEVVERLTGFEPQSLEPSMRVLDDLNMDSIKVTELVSTAAMDLGIAGKVDPSVHINSELGVIASQLAQVMKEHGVTTGSAAASMPAEPVQQPTPQAAPKPEVQVVSAPAPKVEVEEEPYKSPWVRSFYQGLKAFEEAAPAQTQDWRGDRVAVVGKPSAIKVALLAKLKGEGCQISDLSEDFLPTPAQHFDRILFCPTIQQGWSDSEKIMEETKALARMGSLIHSGLLSYTIICPMPVAQKMRTTGYNAWSGTLSQEWPTLAVSLIGFDEGILDMAELTQGLLDFAGSRDQGHHTLFFDQTMKRFTLDHQLVKPHELAHEPVNLGQEDVVLVTGGGAGITAELAYRFAEVYGCKMVLLGRRSLDSAQPNSPILETLNRYRNKGLQAYYEQCDVGNAAALAQTIAKVETSIGPVSGVIHGAGINRPCPIHQVQADGVSNELSGKVIGACNLLNELEAKPLKILVGLTSVIGVLGLKNNAFYGYVNERLDRLFYEYGQTHQKTKVINLAYSVWAEIGMGARMGADKNLRHVGIEPIDPEEGVASFLNIIDKKLPDPQLVITSRMGHLRFNQGPMEAPKEWQFAQNIVFKEMGVEAVTRVTLHPEKDLYLQDHNYKGSLLLPTVFGLEAMAQVAALVTGKADYKSLAIENIGLGKPIIVGPAGVEIEVFAMVKDTPAGQVISCGVRSAMTGFSEPHFTCDIQELIDDSHAQGLSINWSSSWAVDLSTEVYGPLLFQGPRFQKIQDIHHMTSDDITGGEITLSAQMDNQSVAGPLLGDPYLRDVLLQSGQLVIPRDQCLPIGIDRLEIHAPTSQSERVICHTSIYRSEGDTYLANIELQDENGQVLQRLIGYRLKILEHNEALPKASALIEKWSAAKVDVELEEKSESLATPYNAMATRLQMELSPDGPQGQSVLVHRFIPDFKAFANLGKSIYFSHYFSWMGVARELSAIPVMPELRTKLESGRWGLVTNKSSVNVLGYNNNRDRVVEGRMWCTSLGGTHGSSMDLFFEWLSVDEHGPVERIATGTMTATWVEILGHGLVAPSPLPKEYEKFLDCMVAKNDAPNELVSLNQPLADLKPGQEIFEAPSGPKGAVQLASKTFETGLFDANLVGNIYFGNYSIWMGKTRDQFFRQLALEAGYDFETLGELRCVEANVDHLREAMPFDQVKALMKLKKLSDHAVELEFEFYKVEENGELLKLAVGKHKAFWMEQSRTGKTVVTKMPFIKELVAMLEGHRYESVILLDEIPAV